MHIRGSAGFLSSSSSRNLAVSPLPLPRSSTTTTTHIAMAVFGLGSHDEPIVVSDDEDATHVENELNRSFSSSLARLTSSPCAV